MLVLKIIQGHIYGKFDENNIIKIIKALERLGELETFERFDDDKILEILGALEELGTLEELEILEVIEEFE